MESNLKDLAGRYLVNLNAQQIKTTIVNLLEEFDYKFVSANKVGFLFEKLNNPAIFVDVFLEELSPHNYQYVDYTYHQNYLMHKYQGIYRFLWSDEKSLQQDIAVFGTDILEEDLDLSTYGSNRELTHSDPTPPEFNFSQFFEQTFGSKSLHALQAEWNYTDKEGHRRFVDFVLSTEEKQIAIELNGERYHHPLLISNKRYRSQLFKQNSLVHDGYLVYRWSDRGMADQLKLQEQMKAYFGDESRFKSTPHFKAQRQLSFELYPHQASAISKIQKQREHGDTSFLVVLPTGTGKTEVFIEDVKSQIALNPKLKVLAVVPSRALREQLVSRLVESIPNVTIADHISDASNTQILVVTSALILRHFHLFRRDCFDYILIDEAHRAAAIGIRNALEYFIPSTLLGLTATPDRTDKQQLESIFGQYEVDLTLEEAITEGLVPPIRAFRLETNIDFSEVRYNGKEFVKQDINKYVLTPSRNEVIVDLVEEYFGKPLISGQKLKQGVVFCVDIKHTKEMSRLLNKAGIKSVAVDGSNRKGIEQYQKGEVQFICACDLLNEGWDAPQTSIVVMARPTMSKVLYTQQLGRGTRLSDGKEALYVIDVVDSYGPALSPWSLHSVMGLSSYQPFSDVIKPKQSSENEILVLDGLYEGVRKLEPINIFNFEKEFGELLNEEQLARELFVSTGTVRDWRRKGDLAATKELPFGNKALYFYSKESLKEIREKKGLKIRTDETRRDDFFEFLEERDYTFSYKIIFLLTMLKHCNERGEIELETLVDKYQSFYVNLHNKFEKVDKQKSPYNDLSFLNKRKELQRNILANPFEKFERKRFIYQSNELSIISFDQILWDQLTETDIQTAIQMYEKDKTEYFEKLGIKID